MLERYFQLKQMNTTVKVEVVAGVTTFLTMAYIIFVNPDILSKAGMDKQALIAVTCIVTAAATIIVGIFANAPIAMAPGMGLNAFFAYSLVLGDKVNWETALGVVFLSGLFFLLLTLLGLRRKLVEAIPAGLISAISVGIGLFITFIGLVRLGVVVNNEVTLVSAGELTPTVLIGLCGLMVMLFLDAKKIKGALLIGIIFSTVLALIMVGLFMMKEVKQVDFSNLDEGFPAFIIMVMIALSYSISKGLAFGFISFTLIKIITGKTKDIKPAMWVIAILSVISLTQDWLGDMIEYIKNLV